MPESALLNSAPGRLVALALRQSWRDSIAHRPVFSLADFEAVTPLLYDSGAAGLGWWRIRDTALAETPSGKMLHQAFRLLTLQAAIHQTNLRRVFESFRSTPIEPILI